MDTISYSTLRKQLAKTLNQVNEDHAPVMVTRQNGKPAVLVSLEDFESYEETAYLMASPTNAERLHRSIADAEAGRTQAHDLIEP